MLSDEERRDLLAMAGSTSLRDEFRALKAASQLDPSQPVDLDRFMEFLSAMSRLAELQSRAFVHYERVLL
jgi:hypothetical protein